MIVVLQTDIWIVLSFSCSMDTICLVCDTPTSTRCARCKSVYYCSTAHITQVRLSLLNCEVLTRPSYRTGLPTNRTANGSAQPEPTPSMPFYLAPMKPNLGSSNFLGRTWSMKMSEHAGRCWTTSYGSMTRSSLPVLSPPLPATCLSRRLGPTDPLSVAILH